MGPQSLGGPCYAPNFPDKRLIEIGGCTRTRTLDPLIKSFQSMISGCCQPSPMADKSLQ